MVLIRLYSKEDRNSIIEICSKTGYMGDPVEEYFDDSHLFGLLFCLYYVDYEPENCFVAVDETTNQVIGYILSSFDSELQEKNFKEKIIKKIFRRVFLYTIWRYPKSFKAIRYMQKISKSAPKYEKEKELFNEYPAHLHIDILDGYQRKGVGSQLIEILERHLSKHQVKGVHLGTSDRNTKAIPFYYKMGFSLIYEGSPGYNMWKNYPEIKPMIFAKKII